MHPFIKAKTPVRMSAVAVIVAVLLFLGSCTSIERMMAPQEKSTASAEEPRAAAAVPPEKPERLPRFENQYTREELIKALVQFQEFSALADALPRYMWGDRVFEDHLATIAWLESGPYQQGRGVTLAVYNEEGETYAELTRGLVQELPGKGRWWHFNYKSEEIDFSCEYFTDLNAIPRQVLLKNNASGEKVNREPFYTEMLAESESSGAGSKSPPGWFEQLRKEMYQSQLSPLYAGMQILGEEAQLIDGRWIRAVHMRSGSGERALHAWFSPDVPGRLLRIKRSDDHVITKVVKRIDGLKPQSSF